MQFMPATWKDYGVDGNKDGLADPYSPVDAIFAAARYLKAAGADKDLRGAVYAYNHADWYVDSVLLRAQVIGGMPTSLVSLADGPHRGPLPGRLRGHLRGRDHLRRSQEEEAHQRRRHRREHQPPRPLDLRRRRLAGRRGQRRERDQDRRLQAPRPLHPDPGRLRQHVHVRAPVEDLPALRRAQADEGGPGRGQAPAGRAEEGQGARSEAASDTDRPAPKVSANDASIAQDTTAAPRGCRRSPRSRPACSRTRRAPTR